MPSEMHLPRHRPYCGLTPAGWASVGTLLAWGVVIWVARALLP
jgi:hypothetical protein